MSFLIAFKNRKVSDLINRKLVEVARENSKFDVDLVVADGKIVRAHRVILSLYSKVLRRLHVHTAPEKKIIGK